MPGGNTHTTDDHEALPPGADAFSRVLAELADDLWTLDEDDEPPG
jgi:hypothetical protein